MPVVLTTLLALLASMLVAVGATAPANAATTAITEGSLTWGLKQSFRGYITGPIAHGTITADDGATLDLANLATFPLVSGSYDDVSQDTAASFGGSVHYYGHSGALDLTISEPRIEFVAGESYLYAKVVTKDTVDGAFVDVDLGEIPVAVLDLAGGTLQIDGDSGTTTWSGIPAALTAEAVPIFIGEYAAGQALDPVAITYSGPGGGPLEPTEEWDTPGELGYEVLGIAAGGGSPVGLVDDGDALLASATGTYLKLQPFDAETLQPIGTGFTDSATATAVRRSPSLDIDAATNTVYVYANRTATATSARILAISWDPETDTWTREDVTGPVSADPYARIRSGLLKFDDATGALYVGFNNTSAGEQGIARYTKDAGTGEWTRELALLPADGSYMTNLRITTGGIPVATRTNNDTNLPLDVVYATFADGVGQAHVVAGSTVLGYVENDIVENKDGGAFVFNGNPSTALRLVPDGIGGLTVSGEQFVWSASRSVQSRPGVRNVDRTTGMAYLDGGGQTAIFDDDELVGLLPMQESSLDGQTAYGADGTFYRVRTGGIERVRIVGTVPTITTQPQADSVTLPAGVTSAPASFSVAATSTAELSYQWQSRPAGATSVAAWRSIAGATADTLTVDAGVGDNDRQYRVIVTSPAGSVASEAASLTVNYAPQIAIDVANVSVAAGEDAVFSVMSTGNPEPTITWQRRVGGFWQDLVTDDNVVVNGPSLTVVDTNTDQSGSVFRAKVVNSAGTVFSRAATLTVKTGGGSSPSPTPGGGGDSDAGTYTGVTFEWKGSGELQSAPPFGGSNYFSAGVSDGSEATYKAAEGDVSVWHVDGGSESVPSYATRGAHATGSADQIVRFSDGTAEVAEDGSAVITWTGSWSINFYGGLVPFTLTDPVLSIDAAGAGTLRADLAGYAGDMSNPTVKTPLAPVSDVTVATFTGASIDTDGSVSITPAYAGVEITVPGASSSAAAFSVLGLEDEDALLDADEDSEPSESPSASASPSASPSPSATESGSSDTESSDSESQDADGPVLRADGPSFTPQDRTVAGWGGWPQSFVDFHFATGLSSYWYSSGGAADAKKPPLAFTVDFTSAGTDPTDPDPSPSPSVSASPSPTPTPGGSGDLGGGTGVPTTTSGDLARQVLSGSLEWGVKTSFRNYVTGPIAHGTITVSGGVSDNGNGFSWPLGSGYYDPATGETVLRYGGAVVFSGHNGVLDMSISSPQLHFGPGGSVLYASVSSKNMSTGVVQSYNGPVGSIGGSPVITDNTLAINGLGVSLTAQAAPAFAGFYAAGTGLDPITVNATLTAPVVPTASATPTPTATASAAATTTTATTTTTAVFTPTVGTTNPTSTRVVGPGVVLVTEKVAKATKNTIVAKTPTLKLGKAPIVRTPAGRVVQAQVAGLPKRAKVQVFIVSGGQRVPLASMTTTRTGALTLPALRITRKATYNIGIALPNGTVRWIKIRTT